MSQFGRDVAQVLTEVRETLGFVPGVSMKDFVTFVRWVSDDVYHYIFVRDRRRVNSDLVVSLWIAPPEMPDDTLDKLPGFKILLGSSFDVDDAFFVACGKRLIRAADALNPLTDVVRAEMRDPPFVTPRQPIYAKGRAAYEHVRSLAQNGKLACVEECLKLSDGVARRRTSWSKFEECWTQAISLILAQGLLPEDLMEFYRDRPGSLEFALHRQSYAAALGAWSKEIQHGK